MPVVRRGPFCAAKVATARVVGRNLRIFDKVVLWAMGVPRYLKDSEWEFSPDAKVNADRAQKYIAT
jgi:hypothetical protein